MTYDEKAIAHMFNRIANTYDGTNRVLSFGRDAQWRKILLEEIKKDSDIVALDIATGTADILVAMAESHSNLKKAFGIDISENMLTLGQKKISEKKLDSRVQLSLASAHHLPFPDESFDVITIAFGIRNVIDKEQALLECARVLKPDGELLILEFSLPKNPLIKLPYLFYFRHILPVVGGFMSKEIEAYRYLNRTVEAFFDVEEWCEKMRKCGFLTVRKKPLTCGIAHIYCARK